MKGKSTSQLIVDTFFDLYSCHMLPLLACDSTQWEFQLVYNQPFQFPWASLTHFCREINIPYLDYATSIPKKYFNLPNTFILDSFAKGLWSLSFFLDHTCHNYIINKTNMTVTPPEAEYFINNVWFSWLCLYLISITVLVNLPNHALGDCFRPYKAFFNLHTLFLPKPVLKLGNAFI